MQIVLEADCITARLVGRLSLDVYEAIDAATSYVDPDAYRDLDYIHKRWDGKKYFFDQAHDTFPAGLLDRVTSALAGHGVEPQIVDQRALPPWGEAFPAPPTLWGNSGRYDDALTLFPDQQDAFSAFVRAPRGCIAHPTASGKTEIAAAVFRVAGKHARCLYIVDQRELLDQAHARLQLRLGERVGRLGNSFHEQGRDRVTVATIQALHYHVHKYAYEFFPTLSVVAFDEVHTMSERRDHNVLMRIPATVRLGLSGTIKEAKRRMVIEAYLGPIVYEGNVVALIEAGRLARPYFTMIRVGGVLDDATELDEALRTLVWGNAARNAMIVRLMCHFAKLGKRTLVLVQRIPHGFDLANTMTRDHPSYRVDFIHGHSPGAIIKERVRELEDGWLPVLIASRIFDKGKDVPSLDVVIIAGGGRSPVLSLQRVGRGLRKKGDENVVEIYDFFDQGHRTLRNQADERRRTYARKYETAVRVVDTVDLALGVRVTVL